MVIKSTVPVKIRMVMVSSKCWCLVINSVLTKMIWLNTGSVEERMVMMKVCDLRLLSD